MYYRKRSNHSIQATGTSAAELTRLAQWPAPDFCRYSAPNDFQIDARPCFKILLDAVPEYGTIWKMKRKHLKTLELIFSRPVSGNIKWDDIESLFVALGAEVSEREGSRVAVVLFNEVKVFHRPHPIPVTDKGAVASIRKWLESHGVTS
jgi:hypothetical protein